MGPIALHRHRARGSHGLDRSWGADLLSDRITTPFTAESTAEEVLAGVDLSGRRAVVTGHHRASVPRQPGRWPPPARR
jgi:hypothetical protein